MVLFARLFLALGLVSLVYAQSPNVAIYTDQYRQQLEKYRLQSDSTSIAITQYTNLKTLAAQEEAVKSMRDFLLIRADVITTHLNLLNEVLADRQSLDGAWVASGSALLAQQKADIASHRARSDIAVDRIKADQEALWFQTNQKPLLLSADRAQSLIGIGRVGESIMALETIKSHVDTWIADTAMSETSRVEKRRGSDELGRTIQSAKQNLDDAKQVYADADRNSSSALNYEQIRPKLLSAYTNVIRGVGFAKELTQ